MPMNKKTIKIPWTLNWFLILCLVFFWSIPAFAADPINGFRELKFGMSPQEVQALPNCTTPHECMYELSNKNRYIQLTYNSDNLTEGLQTPTNLQLARATIDMGQYEKVWYKELQTILGKSYHLSHDYSEDTQDAFLSGQLQELKAGYGNGQVVLAVIRRQFGNMILKVIYQNTPLAAKFVEEISIRPTPAP